MKILAILGSPHGLKGATNEVLSKVLAACKEQGAKIETIVLSKKKVRYCVGCANCLFHGDCSIKDDVPGIHKKIFEADGIIFASPVYLGTVSGQMKTFLDRCLPLGHRPQLMGKYGLAIAASAGIQDVETRDYLQNALMSFGVSVVGGICGIAVGPGFLEDEEIVTEHATRLGHQLVTAIREKHKYPETGELRRARAFFRDLIIRYQGLFQKDYEYWKEKGWLTLPRDITAEGDSTEDMETIDLDDAAAMAKCREMFELMPTAFNPEEAKNMNATYQFEITSGSDTLVWHLIIKNKTCVCGEGSVKKPSSIVKCSASDWIALTEGRLGGMKAFISGRLKTTGNWRLLTKFENLFTTSA